MSAAPHQHQETEIKLRVESAAWARTRLEAAGFGECAPRVFERNVLLDSQAAPVRAAGCVLRIRTAGDRTTLTFKGPSSVTGSHKTREEIETGASDAGALLQVFSRLGYSVSSRYEKFRTEFSWPDHAGGVAMLDETPIGVFLEFEGSPEWIDEAAQSAGFSAEEYLLDSYSSLFRAYCNDNGLETDADMTFGKTP